MPFAIDELLRTLIKEAVTETLAVAKNGGVVTTPPRLLKVDQATTHIGRTRAAVQHLMASGEIPVVRIDRRVSIDVRIWAG